MTRTGCPTCKRTVKKEWNYRAKLNNWMCRRCKTIFNKPTEYDDVRTMRGPGWKKKLIESPDWDYYEKLILNIQHPLTQAICAVAYLVGPRRNELFDVWQFKYSSKKWVQVGEGIKKRQVKEMPDGTLLFKNLRVEKRRKGKEILRTVPTSTKDVAIITVVKEWIKPLKDSELLFDIKARGKDSTHRPDAIAYNLIKKYAGVNPHQFRHFCMSVRYVRDKFRDVQMQKFGGWSSTQPVQYYAHLSHEDLKEQLEKKS